MKKTNKTINTNNLEYARIFKIYFSYKPVGGNLFSAEKTNFDYLRCTLFSNFIDHKIRQNKLP